jgi:hypothetical protein
LDRIFGATTTYLLIFQNLKRASTVPFNIHVTTLVVYIKQHGDLSNKKYKFGNEKKCHDFL